jgi:hypothetical protein
MTVVFLPCHRVLHPNSRAIHVIYQADVRKIVDVAFYL